MERVPLAPPHPKEARQRNHLAWYACRKEERRRSSLSVKINFSSLQSQSLHSMINRVSQVEVWMIR